MLGSMVSCTVSLVEEIEFGYRWTWEFEKKIIWRGKVLKSCDRASIKTWACYGAGRGATPGITRVGIKRQRIYIVYPENLIREISHKRRITVPGLPSPTLAWGCW